MMMGVLNSLADAAATPHLARCRRHSELTASARCNRCGDHLCDGCVQLRLDDDALCSGCAVIQFEGVRREYVEHEASVRAIGALYYMLAGLYGVAGTIYAVQSIGRAEASPWIVAVVLSSILIPAWVGRDIRRLRPWARSAVVVFAILGLLAFPLGTLVNGYILYLLLGAKGGIVFSEAYRLVVDATPHIRYRAAPLLMAIAAAVLLLAFGGIVAAMLTA